MSRRWVIRLLAFVIAGAMINVAMGWWLAGYDKRPWSGGTTIHYLARGGFHGFGPGEPVVVTAYVKVRCGSTRVVINTWQADHPRFERSKLALGATILPDWIEPESASQFGDVRWEHIMFVDGFGLPYPAMSCAWKDEKTVIDGILLAPRTVAPAAAPAASNPMTMASWFTAPAVVSPARALPLRPIWRGFAFNTGLYSVAAAIAWMILVAIPLWLRRLARVWRGRCVACGYPAGTSAVCTECGRPVKVRAIRSGG